MKTMNPATATANRFRFAVRKAALTLTAAVAVASTQLAFGTPGPDPEPLKSTVFQLDNSLKFKAVATTPHDSQLHIVIRNAKKEIVYAESLRSKGTYLRTFDLSALTDGEYTFEIASGGQAQFKTFRIETTQARVVEMQ